MAGLLDLFNSEEGRFNMGLLAAAAPRMERRGLGERMQDVMGGMDKYRLAQDEKKLRDIQLEEHQAALEAKRLAAAREAEWQTYSRGLFGGGNATPQDALTMGAASGSIGPTVANAARIGQPMGGGGAGTPGGGIASLSANDVGMIKMRYGKDFADVWKLTRPELKDVNGTMVDTRDPTNIGRQFLDPQKAPGYQGQIEAAKAAAGADYEIVTVNVKNPDGSVTPTQMTKAQATQRMRGGAGPNGSNGLDMSRVTPQQLARMAAEDPEALQRGIASFQAGKPLLSPPGASGGGFGVGSSQQEQDRQAARAAADKTYAEGGAKEYVELTSKLNNAGFAAPAQLRKLERMEQLLADADGGRLAPLGLEVASMASSFGIKMDRNLGNKEAAQALSRELAGSLRVPGTGPMTDKDFDNFLLQVPDLSKTAEGRKQIMLTMRNALSRDIKLSNMAREYRKKNGNLDDGFMQEAAQFMAENPVIPLPEGYRVIR